MTEFPLGLTENDKGLQLRTNTELEDMRRSEIGLFAQNIETKYSFIIQHSWKSLCDDLNRKRIFTLTLYNFCTRTLTPNFVSLQL